MCMCHVVYDVENYHRQMIVSYILSNMCFMNIALHDVIFLNVWWMNCLYGRSIQLFGCDHYSAVYILYSITFFFCLLSLLEKLLTILTMHVFVFQLALPSESTTGACFLQHYIESILALQAASCRLAQGWLEKVISVY